jgi:hypothetical protein
MNDTVQGEECSRQAVDMRPEEYQKHQPKHLQPFTTCEHHAALFEKKSYLEAEFHGTPDKAQY